jgi:hypothetical protein
VDAVKSQLLMSAGARVQVENRRGQTPLALTADPRPGGLYFQPLHRSSAELLQKLGAKE